ncbi:MAG: 1,4-alpha-glucan branching protein GlgB [Candidatus Manganitrophaceae bacterium]|nr:MAG: 1,4-alpha-glucan branching protein GlgB [Candidatus Manganitrophaceae bacterium]
MSGKERMQKTLPPAGLLTEHDIYLLKEGSHFKLYDKLGAHLVQEEGARGVYFAVWAPNAEFVSVIGDFNGWDRTAHPLQVRPDGSGVWEGRLTDIGVGAVYKYHIASRHQAYTVEKADPFAFCTEVPPRTASVVWDLHYHWNDSAWMAQRAQRSRMNAPLSVYEMHLGSWRRVPEEGNRSMTYREMAKPLAEYVKEMGFTHVELMPITEHPFFGSWGYQTTGYFSPTRRHGTPQDLMYLIDTLHQNGIGVILDWVPSHFPTDQHGLSYFDGTHLYEHADPRKGFHPDWNSAIFNYGRNEVQAFLISSALFWLEKYHIDGLRIDGVASMLYLDYSRKEGEWIPNMYGGRENLDAISLLKRFNEAIYGNFPDVQTIAEESTAWPMVSRPTYLGGLGFGMKWNMGWMHDTLSYFSKDPVHRKYHHGQLTFSIWYGFSENFVLPLSHDEVVHGKGSLLGRMPGDDWQRFANLRLLFGYMYAHPGKKLLFMGGEFGQSQEWNHDQSLHWHLLQYAPHQQVQQWVRDLNHFYREEPALHQKDFDPTGFEWIDLNDSAASTLSFLRRGDDPSRPVVFIFNFTPVPRLDYRIGVPAEGYWQERLNSDSGFYGGSNLGNSGGISAEPIPSHGRPYSLRITLPPLAVIALKRV